MWVSAPAQFFGTQSHWLLTVIFWKYAGRCTLYCQFVPPYFSESAVVFSFHAIESVQKHQRSWIHLMPDSESSPWEFHPCASAQLLREVSLSCLHRRRLADCYPVAEAKGIARIRNGHGTWPPGSGAEECIRWMSMKLSRYNGWNIRIK